MSSVISNGVEPGNAGPTPVHHHFSAIAQRYHYLRTTDPEPVALIARELGELARIEAIDIGCGSGRYDQLLFKYLDNKLRLTCVDASLSMLKALNKYLYEHGISNYASLRGSAENIISLDNTYDCVCTFNAVHHFNLPGFLGESARILKCGGCLFIYTRLPEQNERNIWGRYFPGFCRKETRLYTPDTLTQSVAAVPNLHIMSIEYFKYGRTASLAQLLKRARSHHYSTFSLYSPEELEEAIAGFTRNIRNTFDDTKQIHWFDENVLFVIRKDS